MKPVNYAIAFFLGCFAGSIAILVALPAHPALPDIHYVTTQKLEAAPVGDAETQRLFERLRPFLHQHVQAELQSVADDLDGAKMEGTEGSFATSLASSIGNFVLKAIKAALVAMLISALLGLLWAYWMYPAVFLGLWLALTTAIAEWRARANLKGK